MKAFVIGDIHGCLTELQKLIEDIDRNETRIILVGDLIDRGPHSRKVIKFVRDNKIECVKGNHEVMAIKCIPYIEQDQYWPLQQSDWFYNGGKAVYDTYSTQTELIADLKWLDTLPLYIETGILDEEGLELLVSHTWCSHKDLTLAEKNSLTFVWDREQPTGINSFSKYYNIFGHTPVDYVNQFKYHRKDNPVLLPEPEFNPGTANVDTGCAYAIQGRGWLTGIEFPSLKVTMVQLGTLKKIML